MRFIVVVCCVLVGLPAYADTVLLKGDVQIKGIVVEKYHDRIVISTVDGEKSIMNNEVDDIIYDRREQNLTRLGDFHMAEGNNRKAYAYYSKACSINPDFKEAREKFMHVRSIILRNPEKQLQMAMQRRQKIFKKSGMVYGGYVSESMPKAVKQNLYSVTGMSLVANNEMPQVEKVALRSPADQAGIDSGDIIYKLWGKLTGYIELQSIANAIVEAPSPEVAISLKKTLVIRPQPRNRKYFTIDGVGFKVVMKEEEGLTISDVDPGSLAMQSGLKRGDLITGINGEKTRYMPIAKAVDNMNTALKKGKLTIVVGRDTILWRKGI